MSRVSTSSECLYFKRVAMESLFVPYEIALTLKELGFDKECFGYYDGNHNLQFMYNGIPEKFTERRMGPANSVWVGWISAPLYQQAFRWFREKYWLVIEISMTEIKHNFEINIFDTNTSKQVFIRKTYEDIFALQFKSYKEAELECLKKLIEIVKEK
jgi:hypothetical protein